MLNREKYAKEILDIVCEGDNFGLQNGRPVPCGNIKCRGCEFYSADCRANSRAWVNREYVEPPVDWSKVVEQLNTCLQRASDTLEYEVLHGSVEDRISETAKVEAFQEAIKIVKDGGTDEEKRHIGTEKKNDKE